MSNPVLEILIVFLLLVANGVFAMAEIAIVSARKARLQQLADTGDARARAALELATHPNQFLATVQIGITLVAGSSRRHERPLGRPTESCHSWLAFWPAPSAGQPSPKR